MKSLLTILCAFAALCLAAVPATEARIDVRVRGEGAKAFTVADKGTSQFILHPKWMQMKNLDGAQVLLKLNGTDWQTDTFSLTAGSAGQLYINVMGPDVRDPETKKRIEAWVDYQKIVVNGKVVFEAKDGKVLSVWHDKSKSFLVIKNLKEGETVKFEVTSRPSAK